MSQLGPEETKTKMQVICGAELQRNKMAKCWNTCCRMVMCPQGTRMKDRIGKSSEKIADTKTIGRRKYAE